MSHHSGSSGAAAGGAAVGSNEPTGVYNLGNTCYMNAVLQALAHAPDLCMAVDVEPHRSSCPTHLGNMKRREEKAKAKKTTEDAKRQENKSDASASAETTSRGGQSSSEAADANASMATASSSGGTKSKGASNGGGGTGKRGKKGRSVSPTPPSSMVDPDHDEGDEYCALCEVEKHMSRVHPYSQLAAATGAGAGAGVVGTEDGSAVAPSTFINGFIGHVAPWFKLGKQEDSHEFLRLLIDAMQKSCATKSPGVDGAPKVQSPENDNGQEKVNKDGSAKEYPFRLFRGIVESNVQCGSCGVTSCKMDPIEDVGLEVVSNGGQLADIDASFKRFVQSEDLDSYKCDKCEKVGKATKTSKLALIPPILTLHLKRFRYGGGAFGGDASSRRGGRSADAPHGSSGSAKIEGHVSFKPVMMIKSYCTAEFVKSSKLTGICRLFAVIVHTGKNSHSGHYIAYVKSTGKGDEWWKVDDAKVTKVPLSEVLNAEAYMLFYRVVKHPMSEELTKEKEELDAKRKADLEAKGLLPVAAAADDNKEGQSAVKFDPTSTSSDAKSALGKRKLKEPELGTGIEWARIKTSLKVEDNLSLKVADELVSENIQLKADYFKILSDAAKDDGPSTTVGVSGKLKTA